MASKLTNRIVGGLEVLAGGICMWKSREYGFGDIGKYFGAFFIGEGLADLITGQAFYLIGNLFPDRSNRK